MAGWKIPELNGGFQNGTSPISMVHLPASHVNRRVPEGNLQELNREFPQGLQQVDQVPMLDGSDGGDLRLKIAIECVDLPSD